MNSGNVILNEISHSKKIMQMIRPLCFLFLAGFVSYGSDIVAQDTGAPIISNNIITSSQNPALNIKVARSLTYLGRHAITIRDVAAGERIVFAETHGTEIKSLFIAQFEAFHPSNDKTYNYNLEGKPLVAGYPWRSNAYGFDMRIARASNPNDEASGTAVLLEDHGFSVPQNWLMWRSLTVTDPDRKSELILFYVEFGKDHNLTIDDIYKDNRETPAWLKLQKQIATRANSIFMLAPSTDEQESSALEWEPIPVSQFQ